MNLNPIKIIFSFLYRTFLRLVIVYFFLSLNIHFLSLQIKDEINWTVTFNFMEEYKLTFLMGYYVFMDILTPYKGSFQDILISYFDMLKYLLICFAISIILFSLSFFFFIKPVKFNEKLLPYECGFNPFDDARKQFSISFYLIALYFIVFDIEAIFIFPWAISFFGLNSFGFYGMVDFFLELLIALIYLIYTDSLEIF